MIPERIRQQNLKLLVSVIPQSFKLIVVRGEFHGSTPRVLPLPVIHTNSFFDHRGASLQILFSKEFLGPIYRPLNFQELLLDNSDYGGGARRIPPQELLLAYSSLKTLIVEQNRILFLTLRESRLSLQCVQRNFSLSNSQEENQNQGFTLSVWGKSTCPLKQGEYLVILKFLK